MIRLFRNMRKKLATENKVLAYSRYAIGEIVLVVVGILIAVSINSRVNAYYDYQKETKYLTELVRDIENIESEMKSHEARRLRVQLACDSLIDAIHLPGPKPSAKVLNHLIDKMIIIVGRPINFQSYNTLKSTSDLNLIKNDAIKLSLSKIELSIVRLDVNIGWEYTQWTDINQVYINQKMDLLDISNYSDTTDESDLYKTSVESIFKNNWEDILKDIEFSNIVMNKKWAIIDIVKAQDALKESLEASKKLIQEELDKRVQ